MSKLWTADEERRLLAMFDLDQTIEGIAKLHERSPAAIATRLVRLERIIYRSGMYHKLEPWSATINYQKG